MIIRLTKQRQAILSLLNEYGHLSFLELKEHLIKEDKDISLATLYRNISSLLDNKLIRKVDLASLKDTYYELVDKKEHDHFICIKCNRLIDVDKKDDSSLSYLDSKNNLILTKNINYYGICKSCLAKDDENKS